MGSQHTQPTSYDVVAARAKFWSQFDQKRWGKVRGLPPVKNLTPKSTEHTTASWALESSHDSGPPSSWEGYPDSMIELLPSQRDSLDRLRSRLSWRRWRCHHCCRRRPSAGRSSRRTCVLL